MMVASVSEWHLWMRRGCLVAPADDDDAALLSKLLNTGLSSLSSLRLLFSCCAAELPGSPHGSLLFDGGPPTCDQIARNDISNRPERGKSARRM